MRTPHNSLYSIDFFNDRVREVIPSEDIAELFTNVPIKAKHMELVGGNAVVFGNITEGYDVIEPDIDVDISYISIDDEQSIFNIDVSRVEWDRQIIEIPEAEPYGYYTRIWAGFAITIPDGDFSGSTLTLSVINNKETPKINAIASYTIQSTDTLADIKTGWQNQMIANGIQVLAGSPANKIYIYNRYKLFFGPAPTNAIYLILKDFTVKAMCGAFGYGAKYPNIKCGATHGFGIVYKDEWGRPCSVVKTPNLNVYIPFYTEASGGDLNELVNLIFKIKNAPPSWDARSYEIVYFGNLTMDYFVQIRASDIVSIGNDRYGINIQQTFDDTFSRNTRWKVMPYEWMEGDRIRLIGVIDNESGLVTKFDELFDYEIEYTGDETGNEFEGDYLYITGENVPVDFVGSKNILVEVYRPKKGIGEIVAYGTGLVFDIGVDLYGNKYHKGNVDQIIDANGVVITMAEVHNIIVKDGEIIVKAHDSYKFERLNYYIGETTAIYPFWAESVAPSDWWSNIWSGWTVYKKLTSMGFPFLYDVTLRQIYLPERIRHGGFLITGTRTNNIARFDYKDFLDLPKKNGEITALREVGYVLKVLQMYKETSIYVNRIVNFSADGTEEFTLTNKFLATVYPLSTDYGCQHPDSVMVNGRSLYFWDNSHGYFIRSAPNGQVVLDIKMKRWFKDLVKWIEENGGSNNLEVHTGANNEHDEVWCTFRMGDDVKGFIFSERDGRFKSEINQKTEGYIHLGVFFAHVWRQRIWIMNVDKGQKYLYWSGEPVHAEVQFASNIEFLRNKIFNACALYTDHQWKSEERSIVIPEEASAVNEIMETNISVWDRREGIFYGKILKDINSRGNFVNDNDRKINGRAMRGRYCYLKFITEEHDEKVKLDSIIVFSTISERSG